MGANRLNGLVIAACLAGAGPAAAGLVVGPGPGGLAAPPADPEVPLLLAGMLLVEGDLLPDAQPAGEVAHEGEIRRARQEQPPPSASTQTKQVGEMTNTQVTGQVRTRGLIDNLSQYQSGRGNVQSLAVGSVTDTQVVGTVDVKAHVRQGDQRQIGETNRQDLSVGGVR